MAVPVGVLVLPKASNRTATGCVEKATPAVAVDDGLVERPTAAGVPTVGEKLGAVPPVLAAVRLPSVAVNCCATGCTLVATRLAKAEPLVKLILVAVPKEVPPTLGRMRNGEVARPPKVRLTGVFKPVS